MQRETGTKVTVPSVTVGSLVEKKGWKKITLISDIEGGEIDLIKHEGKTLQEHVAVFIVEMHPVIMGEEPVTHAVQRMKDLGFELRDKQKDVHVFYNPRLA